MNGEIVNNVWSTRIQHTVPSLLLLTPYIHFEIGPKVSLENSSALSAAVIITILAFIFSYLTEVIGDYVYECIFFTAVKKEDRNFLNTKNRPIDFGTVLGIKEKAYRKRAKVLSALILPSISTFLCFTLHDDVSIPWSVNIAVIIGIGFLIWRAVSYIKRYVRVTKTLSG
ncbi:hypothetical protein [Bermanella sp. R86510]|uniref:hypothetical protein n=1 Tax=unclassified Bermanella TaxID=2627862 RepID=UPI0037CB115D